MTTISTQLDELRARIAKNPGANDFVELAKLLEHDPGTRPEAREVCFRGLNENPKHLLGRLQLARLFYLDNLGEFAVRELVELRKYSSAPSIEKLLSAFGEFARPFLPAEPAAAAPAAAGAAPDATAAAEEAVVAEFDLDTEFTEAFDEIKQS